MSAGEPGYRQWKPSQRMLTGNPNHLGKILEPGSVTCGPSAQGRNGPGSLGPSKRRTPRSRRAAPHPPSDSTTTGRSRLLRKSRVPASQEWYNSQAWRNPWRPSRTAGTPVVRSCLQPDHSQSRGKRRVKMRVRSIACLALAVLPWQAQAQEVLGRLVLEGGIVGGKSGAFPAHCTGIKGGRGPVSLYGMVESHRCADLAGLANRVGTSVLLGRYRWLVRPAVRTGIEYDSGDVSPTAGGTFFGSPRGSIQRQDLGAVSDRGRGRRFEFLGSRTPRQVCDVAV